MESLIADREVLYFASARGCPACEAAAPELDRFMRKHPELIVLTIDAEGPFPERLGLTIKATPTYALAVGGQVVGAVHGAMRVADIEKWLRRVHR